MYRLSWPSRSISVNEMQHKRVQVHGRQSILEQISKTVDLPFRAQS